MLRCQQTILGQIIIIPVPSVVCFDQLLGAAPTQKLVETFIFDKQHNNIKMRGDKVTYDQGGWVKIPLLPNNVKGAGQQGHDTTYLCLIIPLLTTIQQLSA